VDVLILLPSGTLMGGNRTTANRYAQLLEALGHSVTIHDQLADEPPGVLIAIHALKSHEALSKFHTLHPGIPTVLVLAGTDIYPEPSKLALQSIRIADRLVVLQDSALRMIPAENREKARTIIQSAEAAPGPQAGRSSESFDICVVGHLRPVKDPLRAAAAARQLPPTSTIRIQHAGGIRGEEFAALVEREQVENPRYTWLGELPAAQARELIAASRLQVLSSITEGGAQVLGESIVSGTPLLASRHDAALSLLGEDYPGLFDIGDTGHLAALMIRAETEPAFLAELQSRTHSLAGQFDPQRERDAWCDLLSELCYQPSGTMRSPDEQSD
jgi:putative glycosyltransferase (TIGR04348 family)